MKRIYHCFSGKIKTLEFIGKGRMIKWRADLPKGTTSVWYDFETERNYIIPDNAWEVLEIKYFDYTDEGEEYERA